MSEELEDIEYTQCYNCGADSFQITGWQTADAGPRAPAHRAIDYSCYNCGAHYIKHYEFRKFVGTEKK